jgi:hypothetical protein
MDVLMKVKSLAADYWTQITRKKEFLDNLMKEGLDPRLIGRAIRHMTRPPYECHEVFFEIPVIDKIKRSDPEKCKNILYANRYLSALLGNPIIETEEKKALTFFRERITKEYDLDHPDYKALLDSFRSETNITRVEDYDDADYSDTGFGLEIDAHLRTEQQCEGKLIDMLTIYIEKFSKVINDKMPVGHERDYTRRDTFELIAEIFNLRAPGEYDYEKIRTSHGNFLKAKA